MSLDYKNIVNRKKLVNIPLAVGYYSCLCHIHTTGGDGEGGGGILYYIRLFIHDRRAEMVLGKMRNNIPNWVI